MMADSDRDGFEATPAAAMLLLQLAASQAEIGPFARRALATPQVAARCYRMAMAAQTLKAQRRVA